MNLERSRPVGWRRFEVPVTEAVVLASVLVVEWSTRHGENPENRGYEGILVLLIVAAPALVLVPLTRFPPVRHVACLVALLAWLPLAWRGDLSCTDCGFALLIPINLALLQLGLFFVSVVLRYKRDRPRDIADPRPC